MNAAQSGWYPDPYGRHQRRYYDGNAWTEHVADAVGNQGTDPAPLAPQVEQSLQSPPTTSGWGAPQPTSQYPTSPPDAAQPGYQAYQQPQRPATSGGYEAPAPAPSSSGPLTSHFLGAIVAVAGAIVTFIGLFSLDWMSISADEESADLSRRVLGASVTDDDVFDVGWLLSSFFQIGWLITLVVSIAAVGAALLRQGALRLALAALALLCAIWTLLATMAASDPMEDGVQTVFGIDGSASLQLGVWFTLIGVIVAGAGAMIAFSQESTTASPSRDR